MITTINRLLGLEQRTVRVVTGVGVGQDSALNRLFGPGARTTAGVEVTEETAMGLSAVYAAVRLLSWSRAMLPLPTYQATGGEGDKEPRRDHPVYRLLQRQPNPEMTAFTFRAMQGQYELMWGNSFAWIEFAGDGTPVHLWPLPAPEVRVTRLSRGQIYYDISSMANPPTDRKILSGLEVFHVPNVVGSGRSSELPGVLGKSVIGYAREQMGEALAAQGFAGGFYSGGATPNIMLKHPGKLNDPGKLRDQWKATHGKPGAGPVVLEEGMDVSTIGMGLADAQFIESRGFHVAEVARWFGIPPHKLRDLIRATFSNIAEQKLEWLEDLLPWLLMTEQEANRKLFTEPEQASGLFVEHNVEGMLRGDIEKRYKAYSIGVQWGWLTRNQIRRKENLNSMGPTGDVYMVPQNMQAADKLTEDTEPQWLIGDEQRSTLKASLRKSFEEAFGRMFHREAAEIRSASKTPGHFVGEINRLYDRFSTKFDVALRPVADACRALGHPAEIPELIVEHCRTSKAAWLELAGQVGPAELAERVERELTGREGLAEELAGRLFGGE